MKKIFNLLASITLVTSTTGMVASCSSSQQPKVHQKVPETKMKQAPTMMHHAESIASVPFHRNNSLTNVDGISKIKSFNNVIYVGTEDGGLYQSTDNGKTFVPNKSIPSVWVKQIFTFNQNIYVVTRAEAGQVYRSTDNGKTFSLVTFPKNVFISKLTVIGQTIYALGSGLWESTNNGQTFTLNKSIPPNALITKVTSIKGVIYVGTDYNGFTRVSDGLYQSFDGGKTFVRNISFPTDTKIYQIFAFNNTIYIGTSSNLYTSGLYESFDNGQIFTENATFTTKEADISKIVAIDGVVYVLSTRVDDQFSVYQSFDNGKTFIENTTIPSVDGSTDVKKIDNTIYLASAYNGLYESFDNGKTFVHNQSFPVKDDTGYPNFIYRMDKIDNVIYVVAANGLYESFDNGANFYPNWTVSGLLEVDDVTPVVQINNHLYVGAEDGVYEH